MRWFLGTVAIAVLTASPSSAAETKFALDGENTAVKWVGTKADGKHEGGFKKVTGTATAEGTDPTKLGLDVTIATESLYSDNEQLTAHLKSPDFFDVRRYPKATFKSKKVEKTRDGYKVTGDLTLLGKTKSVSFPAKITLSGDTLRLDGQTAIDRTEFGMTYGQGKVDAKVPLTISIDARRK